MKVRKKLRRWIRKGGKDSETTITKRKIEKNY